jgi:hypothetical protein
MGGLAFCFKSRSSKALLVRCGMITPGELAWHGVAWWGIHPVPSAGSCARAKPGLAGVLAACMFMSRAATAMDGWMVMVVGVR